LCIYNLFLPYKEDYYRTSIISVSLGDNIANWLGISSTFSIDVHYHALQLGNSYMFNKKIAKVHFGHLGSMLLPYLKRAE
jgi:hypothetical protein